jgi:hypothetical protein
MGRPKSYRKKEEDPLILALACGGLDRGPARQCKLNERTVYRRLEDPVFKARVQEARGEMVKRSAGMLTAAAGESVRTLLSLQKDSAPPAIRLGAARAVLELGIKVRELADLEARIAALEAQADFTAVGRSVVEALRRTKVSAYLKPATVTAGLTARPDDRGGWLVPRTELVGLMQVLLQSGRIKVADALPEADTLLGELEAFKAEVPTKIDDDLAAWRERDHDDLVLATALAAWEGDRYGGCYFAWASLPSVIEPGRGHSAGWWWSELR